MSHHSAPVPSEASATARSVLRTVAALAPLLLAAVVLVGPSVAVYAMAHAQRNEALTAPVAPAAAAGQSTCVTYPALQLAPLPDDGTPLADGSGGARVPRSVFAVAAGWHGSVTAGVTSDGRRQIVVTHAPGDPEVTACIRRDAGWRAAARADAPAPLAIGYFAVDGET